MNYSDMKLAELKTAAKDKGIKGYSTMKKAELVSALDSADKPVEKPSMVEAIVAAIRNARQERSNKGRMAGIQADKVSKLHPATKEHTYRMQRGSHTAKLTGAQSRRVRKTQAKLYNMNRNNMCNGFGQQSFTYS